MVSRWIGCERVVRVAGFVHVAVGGDESDEFKRQNQLLIERWRLCPMENIPLPGTNHFTVVEQLGLADSPLHQAALRMMQIQSR